MSRITYVTREQMRELDRIAIEEYHIPAVVLMENAGRAVALEAIKMLKHLRGDQVGIICGTGNNGGDGLVAARHLFNQGIKVRIFYLGKIKESLNKTEAGLNLTIVLKMKIPCQELLPHTLKSTLAQLKSVSLIIDAIFGIGLERPVEGFKKELIDTINSLGKPILSVDIPSGLDPNHGIPLGATIKATKTVTLGAAKIGFKNPSARYWLGKLIVVDIGIPQILLKLSS